MATRKIIRMGNPILATIAQPMDVYSYSMVLWELYSRKRPAEGFPAYIGSGRNAGLVPIWASNGLRPPLATGFSGQCPARWAKLCRSCWQQEATARPTFHAICNQLQAGKQVESGPGKHSWTGYDWSPIGPEQRTGLDRALIALNFSKSLLARNASMVPLPFDLIEEVVKMAA